MNAVPMTNEACRARLRAVRRARARQMNEPPRLTVGEEIFNAVSHGLGALGAAAAMTALLIRADTALETVAAWVYGVSMVLMMAMSSVYHAMPSGSVSKRVCRRFDYISIYLLIGGTFTPIFLVYLGKGLGVTLFCIQWGVILFGATLIAVLGPGRLRPLHYTLFFVIGWSGLIFIPSFYRTVRPLLWFILVGGLAYTVGMIPFARRHKYDHCLWHVFVLAGAALQWVGIYRYLY